MWEIALACNAACIHCGSWAGRPRADGFRPRSARRLCCPRRLGVREVTLSGGEPLLRPDWKRIAAALVSHGLAVEIISNGLALDFAMAGRLAQAGVGNVA